MEKINLTGVSGWTDKKSCWTTPVTDGICFVWDVIYIVELKKVGKREKARTAGPHSVRHFARFCASLLVFCAFAVSRDFPRWLTTI
jgi:hypothetical protein